MIARDRLSGKDEWMFGLFGFDPKKFTDDELLERVNELGRRMVWAARMGQFEMAAQLQGVKLICEQEQRERAIGPRFQRMMQGPAVVVETDPDLARAARQERDAKAERDAPKKGPRAKPFAITKERLKPSTRPSSDD
jgi:hypothetical protein